MIGLDIKRVEDLCKEVKAPTNETMAKGIEKVLKSLDIAQEAMESLDYINTEHFQIVPLKHTSCFQYDYVRACVNTGSSEGIYVDVDLETEGPGDECRKCHLMTLKTLGTSFECYAQMGLLSGLITVIGEYYLLVNDDLIASAEIAEPVKAAYSVWRPRIGRIFLTDREAEECYKAVNKRYNLLDLDQVLDELLGKADPKYRILRKADREELLERAEARYAAVGRRCDPEKEAHEMERILMDEAELMLKRAG